MAETRRRVLVTGGAGFIGSHTVVELIGAGYEPVIVDDLSNASAGPFHCAGVVCSGAPASSAPLTGELRRRHLSSWPMAPAAGAVQRVEQIVGRRVPFHRVNIEDAAALEAVFAAYGGCRCSDIATSTSAAGSSDRDDVGTEPPFAAVIHFAGFKAVGESVRKPLMYYRNNLCGTLQLLEVSDAATARTGGAPFMPAPAGVREQTMRRHRVKRLVFSSSATVYGQPQYLPIPETHPLNAMSPYGRTKLFIEEILRDLANAEPDMSIVLLRYFNPIGAHSSGLIGEDPRGIPNNLMPYVAQVAIGRLPHLNVFGNDYDTPDGTGVRDYIHVVDLALGHVAALRRFDAGQPVGCEVYNLGTGSGYSVLEMIRAMERVSGRTIPYVIAGRRPGDASSVYADVSLARRQLGWSTKRGLDEACVDLWRWQQMNPHGYDSKATASS